MDPHRLHGPRRSEWPARLAASVVAQPLPPRSARRSLSLDVTSGDGGARLVAVGRDVAVARGGVAVVTGETRLEIEYAADEALTITSLHATSDGRISSADAALNELVGQRGRLGFRFAAATLLDRVGHPERSLLRSILHDAPIAVALRVAAAPPEEPYVATAPHRPPTDLCAGYRAGGVLEAWTAVRGPRRLGVGPPAEPIVSEIDPGAFPDAGPRVPGVMSRRRRVDVQIGDDGSAAFVSMFRDAVLERGDPVGVETVVHEYVVTGRVASDGDTIESCVARPIVLPAPDCPAAAASAGRLVGARASDAQRQVREEFTGTSTCTHLNDALWMVGAVPELVRQAQLERPAED